MTDSATDDDAKLLSILAEGINPFTGEVMATDHVLQNPQVIRALFHASHALGNNQNVTKRSSNLPENVGARWSKEEDQKLIQEFDDKLKIPEIAKLHKRTRGSINSRLVRLGKISIR